MDTRNSDVLKSLPQTEHNSIIVDEDEIAAVDGNQDLSKEWKIVRRYETNEVIYHNQYRAEVVEHSKRAGD